MSYRVWKGERCVRAREKTTEQKREKGMDMLLLGQMLIELNYLLLAVIDGLCPGGQGAPPLLVLLTLTTATATTTAPLAAVFTLPPSATAAAAATGPSSPLFLLLLLVLVLVGGA